MSKFHYRYVETPSEYGLEVSLSYYLVLRETRCGFWIAPVYGFWFDETPIEDRTFDTQYYEDSKVWVSKTSNKRRAYPTKEEAYTSYLKRKTRQIKILTAQLDFAKRALKIAEEQEDVLLSTGLGKETRNLFPF